MPLHWLGQISTLADGSMIVNGSTDNFKVGDPFYVKRHSLSTRDSKLEYGTLVTLTN